MTAAARRAPAVPAAEQFPTELTERPQWLVWRFVQKPDQRKPAKMPYYADGGLRHGQQGSDDDRARLVTFERAHAAALAGGFDGVGFAFLPGDGLVGIDLDAACSSKHSAIVQACATFAEVSPSGTGVHIIGYGETETFKDNTVGIEVFCGRQFFTMTGATLADATSLQAIPVETIDKLRRTVQAAKDADREAKEAAAPARAPAAPVATSQPRQGGSVERYVTAAWDAALGRVRSAAEGGRNDNLNQEAYGLGRLLHLGAFTEDEAERALADAAAACGLPPGEAKATIRSGLSKGKLSPRHVEERTERRLAAPQRQAQRPAETVDPDTGEIIPAPANDNTPAPYDLHAVDWFAPFPDTNAKGKPLSTIENVAEACRRLRVVVRYNVISKDLELLIPGQGFSVDNKANASLAWLTSACKRFGVPTEQLGDFLTYLGDCNLYNPVAEWITSQPWDGVPRLQALLDTIEAEGQADDLRVLDLKEAMLRRWMTSACAAAFRPNGVSAHGVLVLQGDQYLGKTAWFKSLVPADLGVIQDGLMLRPDDRDSVKQVVSFWMVELGELDATFRKSDIAQLKSFLTRDRDTIRRAYAKLESNYARRTVFFASVNPRQFLHDPTGNRRYWTISAAKIDHQHGLDMQQVWAEVYETLYRAGAGWYLSADEMALLNEHNKDHEVLDPIRERLQSKLSWNEPKGVWRWVSATDLMAEIGFDRPSRADVTQCGQIMLELNGGQHKKSNGRRLTLAPPKLSTFGT